MDKIFSLIKNAPDDILWHFSKDVHDLIMDKYFSQVWEDNTHKFKYSNHASISEKANALNPESVLDVGCGFNKYKELIKCSRFVGIDPYNNSADVKKGVYEYYMENKEEQFDVVLALGSVNFGSHDKIIAEIDCVDKMTKPGGTQFWRVNPNTKHNNHEGFYLNELMTWYPWDRAFIENLAEIYGYEIKDYQEEINDQGHTRMYFEFYKYP